MEKQALLNTYINNVTMPETIVAIERMIETDKKSYVVAINVDVVMKIEKDAYLKNIVDNASMVLVDGKPLVWISKLYGKPLKAKISGSDLVPLLCEVAAEKGYKIFIIGGKDGIAEQAKEKLESQLPKIKIVGTYAPPFGFEKDESELNKINQMISKAHPDLLITCFGCPKQEKWIYYDQFVIVNDGSSDSSKDIRWTNCGSKKGWKFFLHLYRYVLKERMPDMNFCIHWMCGIAALILKFITHTPYTVMVHGNEIMKCSRKSIKVIIRDNLLRKLILDNASIIFANSDFSRKLCSEICDNKNIVVVDPPIKYVKYPNCCNKNFVIFSIGRHVERKGFQDVINAMPLILKKYPLLQYRIAGDGPYHNELVQCVQELGLEKNVIFLGKTSEEEKQIELSNCDIFIMTSHEDKSALQVEGFGVCYLEANMHGKWVIARDTGGVSDAVVNNITGFLLDDSNPDNICKSIDFFYKNFETFDNKKSISWAKEHDVKLIADEYIQNIKNLVLGE